jgi:NAD(P)-dependent dehydrogenase (short-subunit alcohol dehydrogenase family)
MTDPSYFVFTGVTSGLGMEAARNVASSCSKNMIVAGVRDPENAQALRDAIPASQLILFELDTSSLASVEAFAAAAKEVIGASSIVGIALNAGVQITDGDRNSVDGFELTFATNVLGHVALFNLLRCKLAPQAIVVSTASGTHDADHKLAKPYGFRGGVFPSSHAVAMGDVSNSDNAAQVGRDRYSTSKLCNIMFTYAMAREFGDTGPRFIAFDPGLMPGTGLARTQPVIVRAAWRYVLPLAVRFIDGASTAERSGAQLAALLTGQAHPQGTGLHIEFTGNEIRSAPISHDEAKQDELMEWIADATQRVCKAA